MDTVNSRREVGPWRDAKTFYPLFPQPCSSLPRRVLRARMPFVLFASLLSTRWDRSCKRPGSGTCCIRTSRILFFCPSSLSLYAGYGLNVSDNTPAEHIAISRFIGVTTCGIVCESCAYVRDICMNKA